MMFAGSFGLILALYACKWLLLANVRHRGVSICCFLLLLVLAAATASLISCDWDNDQVFPISNYVGNPVAFLTVPTFSYFHDLARGKSPKRQIIRTVLELALAVPAWLVFWFICEVYLLGWVWV